MLYYNAYTVFHLSIHDCCISFLVGITISPLLNCKKVDMVRPVFLYQGYLHSIVPKEGNILLELRLYKLKKLLWGKIHESCRRTASQCCFEIPDECLIE